MEERVGDEKLIIISSGAEAVFVCVIKNLQKSRPNCRVGLR